MGLVLTYNNKNTVNENTTNVPVPVPVQRANYMSMNRLINNSTNPMSMRSIISIPASSCSSCGH
jgi:hypothetical protein